MSDISYGELYAGIHLSQDPSREERRVQRLLAVNRIEIRLPGTLDIAKRAGQLYSSYLRKRGEGCQKDTARFLDRRPCRSLRIPACNLESGGLQELSLDRGPDPWRGYQRERAHPEDCRNYLSIEVRTPGEVIKESEPPRKVLRKQPT